MSIPQDDHAKPYEIKRLGEYDITTLHTPTDDRLFVGDVIGSGNVLDSVVEALEKDIDDGLLPLNKQ